MEGRDIWFLGAHWLASLAKWSFQFNGRSCLMKGRLTMPSSHFHMCMQALQHTQTYASHTKLHSALQSLSPCILCCLLFLSQCVAHQKVSHEINIAFCRTSAYYYKKYKLYLYVQSIHICKYNGLAILYMHTSVSSGGVDQRQVDPRSLIAPTA